MPTDLLTLLSPSNLVLFVIIFTRLSGLMASAPLFSTFPIPNQIKAWLIASIAFVFFPFILAKSGFQMPPSMPGLLMILLKEFMVGFVIGFLANMIFIGIEMAADILSIQMGLSMAQALNPTSGDTVPLLAQAYSFIAGILFLSLNFHQMLFVAVYKSYQAFPIGADFLLSGPFVEQVIYMSSQVFIIALSVALPVFAVLLATDVLLGFTAKMMPQMNIFMVAMPLKIYIGLMMIFLLLRPTTEYLIVLLERTFSAISAMF